MQSTLIIIFGQLAASLPMLLVLIGGMVWTGMFWRRAPRAAMLAMGGLVVILLSTVGGIAMQAYLVTNRTGTANLGEVLALLGFAFGIVRAAGLALVVAAVFANRGMAGGAFPVQPGELPMAGLASPTVGSRDDQI